MNDPTLRHRHNLPRKKARYDNIESRFRRKIYKEKEELFKENELSPHHH